MTKTFKGKNLIRTIFLFVVILSLAIASIACDTQEEPEPNGTDPQVETPDNTDEPEPETPSDGLEIHVYTRDSASGTREGFESVIGFGGELTDLASEVASNGEMANQVGNDKSGVGYVSLVTNFEENNLKPLAYNGVAPSVEATVNEEYTLSRPFAYTTRAPGDYESDDQEAIVKAFVAFLTESTEGLEAVADAGGIVDVESGKPWDEVKADHPIVDQDNSHLTIKTGGSTSVEKAVQAALETFQVHAVIVQFSLDQTGSSDGHARVLGEEKDGPNASDIGFASRNFKDTEDVTDAIYSGTFCQDAIVVVVNADNDLIDDATTEDLYAIFTGQVSDWSDVGN